MDVWDLARTRNRNLVVYRSGQDGFLGRYNPSVSYFFTGGETTQDFENNWEYYQKMVKHHKVAAFDNGGPFKNQKRTYSDDGNIYHVGSSKGYEYIGPLFAQCSSANETHKAWYPAMTASEDSELHGLGTHAISACAPTNKHANAFEFIGELYRDGLPAFFGVNTALRRDVAGEYLNYEFGIKPLVSDIKSLIDAYKKADKYMAQYQRDAGKLVRRGYSYPPKKEVTLDTSVSGVSPFGNIPAPLYSNRYGTLRTVETTSTERWFSGAFTYLAPDPRGLSAIRDALAKYDNLIGGLPTISGIYNLAPWSWLIDWVTNMGDVLNNVSMMASDGLIMQYGYMMEHKVRHTQYTHTGATLINGTPVNAVQDFITESKHRVRASPFGFGFDISALSSRQIAILTALGFTQGSRRMAF